MNPFKSNLNFLCGFYLFTITLYQYISQNVLSYFQKYSDHYIVIFIILSFIEKTLNIFYRILHLFHG